MMFSTFLNVFLGFLTVTLIFTGCFGYENPGAPRGINLYSVYYPAEGIATERDLVGMSHISISRLPDAPSSVGYLRTIYYSREPSSMPDEEVFAIAVEKLRNRIKRLEAEHPVLMNSKAPFDFVQLRLFRVNSRDSNSLGEYSLLTIVNKSELLDPNVSASELLKEAKISQTCEIEQKFDHIKEHFRLMKTDTGL